MTLWHGGDLAGVTSKLDYIHGLGCRAIWISPLFQNGWGDYHQYAQEDFTLIDKRMGTLEDLRQLTDAAHARGMYVLIDIVVNHMANKLSFDGREGRSAPFVLHDAEYKLSSRDPAVAQPYEDYKYNNTFNPEGGYTGNGYVFYLSLIHI